MVGKRGRKETMQPLFESGEGGPVSRKDLVRIQDELGDVAWGGGGCRGRGEEKKRHFGTRGMAFAWPIKKNPLMDRGEKEKMSEQRV